MKDLDNNIANENTADIHEDKDSSEKVINNVVSPQDIKKGSKENEEGLQENSQGVQKEDQAFAQKGQGVQENGKNFEEESKNSPQKGDNSGQENVEHRQISNQYSSYYQPPYYYPNMSGEGEPSVREKNERSTAGWGITVAVLAIATAAMLLLTIGFFAKGFFARINPETMTVNKNSPKIEFVKSEDTNYIPKTLPEVVAKVGDSVVEIQTASVAFGGFYNQYVTSGAGSGVIVTQSDEAGYIITNYHVINTNNGISPKITVILSNREEYTAQVVGRSSNLDLAILRIEKKESEVFTQAAWGSSGNLVVGQDVIAIGNPLGSLGGTVTDGIISALDREVKVDGVTMTLLQHNAAINPGNSGGGLFDMMGNLVGVVNAKKSDTGIEGLGFAIPAEIAFDFFNRVMSEELSSGLGITVAYIPSNQSFDEGMYVNESSIEGLVRGDRIIKFNNTEIKDSLDYYAAISKVNKGESVSITIKRITNGGLYTIEHTEKITMK